MFIALGVLIIAFAVAIPARNQPRTLAKVGLGAIVLFAVGIAIAVATSNFGIGYLAASMLISGAAVLLVALLATVAARRADGADVMYDARKHR